MSSLKTAGKLLLSLVLGLTLQSPAYSQGQDKPMSPVIEQKMDDDKACNTDRSEADKKDTIGKADIAPGENNQPEYGGPAGGCGAIPQQNQAKQTNPQKGSSGSGAGGGQIPMFERTDFRRYEDAPRKYITKSDSKEAVSTGMYHAYLQADQNIGPAGFPTPGAGFLAGGPWILNAGSSGSGAAGRGSGERQASGKPVTGAQTAAAAGRAAAVDQQASANPKASSSKAKSNGQSQQSSAASSAGEDAMECLINAFDGMTLNLINVGNEDAGSPCSANQVSKTYANAVWMVQRMYKQCFLPMAVLFLLPGALITNMKTFISFGFLHNANDEDAVSPFTGILRSIIAIFLIPMTQVIISYMVDVGNSLQTSCQPYISIPTIILWCEEQIQTFKPDQQGGPIKNLPNVPMAPYRGKFAGMSVKGAVMEQVSGLDSALAELANECMHVLSEGLTIAYAFQLVMLCYLFCLGPLAAAFFAWPSVGRDLFRKAFAAWVDGVVILCLWKFWWNVVLITMTVHCESGGMNPFDPFEVYYLVAFLCILMFVPFNPFDFKPGEIVGHAMEKAQAVAAKVAQGGKGGGSGGGGAKGGGRCPAPGSG